MTKLNIEKVEEQLYLGINTEGLPYLQNDPFEIYEDLKHSDLDAYSCRTTLMTLLAKTADQAMKKTMDVQTLSSFIQNECGFKEDIASEFAEMYLSLLDKRQLLKWKKREYDGFQKLCEQMEWQMHIDLSAIWMTDHGHMDCSYEADIDVSINDESLLKKKITDLLAGEPFISAKDIQDYLEREVQDEADSDFHHFCNEDDYYEPCVEDYAENLEYDILIPFCREYGLDLIEIDGYGHDEGWQSDRASWKREQLYD